ncbi:MAG: hypothetical protein NZ789_04210 [Pseudomonadales bacterium]|nr:hypothetical protein [Pseudomonadales bacterium]
MSVFNQSYGDYDDYYGRLVTHHVDLADSRDLKALLQVKFIW